MKKYEIIDTSNIYTDNVYTESMFDDEYSQYEYSQYEEVKIVDLVYLDKDSKRRLLQSIFDLPYTTTVDEILKTIKEQI